MIQQHLNESIEILDKLITLTQEDIANIKAAKHDTVEKSVQEKNELIRAFQNAKKQLDNSLIELSDNGKNNLSELLSDKDKEKLAEFKQRLKTLHSTNKEYAKLVLVVKNYFDGLISTLFDEGSGTDNAYKNAKVNVDSLFKINV